MSLVDGRVIRQRMDAKDARMARELKRRMNRNGSCATVKHQAPLERGITNVTDATRWRLVILHPRPEIRAAGQRAWDAETSRAENPYEILSVEWANWEAGWWDRQKANE